MASSSTSYSINPTPPHTGKNRLWKTGYKCTAANQDHKEIKMADGPSSVQREESFEEWLICRMRQLGLDEDVFGSYVTGVLDSEDTDEDRKDALIGILEGMTVGRKLN